jgi:DNA-binding MarR family transcriptional regulator
MDGVFLFQALAARSGMSMTDLQCVTLLTSTGPMTAGRLAEEMGLTTGAITGLINRLEQAGYVRREKDPTDGRRVVIQPVMEALSRVDVGVLVGQDDVLPDLMADFDDDELATVLKLMRKSNAFTHDAIARLRAPAHAAGDGELRAPLTTAEPTRLVFANGVSRLTLRADAGMDDLYRARFTGAVPKIDVAHGEVTVRFPRRFKFLGPGDHVGEMTLNPAVPWAIDVRGGAAEIDADLSSLSLVSFGVTWGLTTLALQLPEPVGVVPVRLTGGVANVDIRRPLGTQARLTVKGGFGKLDFDGESVFPTGGKPQVQSSKFPGVLRWSRSSNSFASCPGCRSRPAGRRWHGPCPAHWPSALPGVSGTCSNIMHAARWTTSLPWAMRWRRVLYRPRVPGRIRSGS